MAKIPQGKSVRLDELKSWHKNSNSALARGRAVRARAFTASQMRELKGLISKSSSLHTKAAIAYRRLIEEHEELVGLAKPRGRTKPNPLVMLEGIIQNHQDLANHLYGTVVSGKTILARLKVKPKKFWVHQLANAA